MYPLSRTHPRIINWCPAWCLEQQAENEKNRKIDRVCPGGAQNLNEIFLFPSILKSINEYLPHLVGSVFHEENIRLPDLSVMGECIEGAPLPKISFSFIF